MKVNKHKIYYIGSNKFLKVERERGVSPAYWQRTVMTFGQMFEFLNWYGDNVWELFKQDKKIEIAFKASKDEYEFIQNVRHLVKETPIKGELHELNDYTVNKGMLIYDYATTKKMFVVLG